MDEPLTAEPGLRPEPGLAPGWHPAPAPRIGRGGVLGWVDPRWRNAPERLLGDPAEALATLATLTPERWLRRIPGRSTFLWGPPGAGGDTLVVKRFEGDLAGERWYERLRAGRGGRGSPARREARNLRRLAGEGFPVPRALAWFEAPGPSRAGPRGASALVMEHLAHEEHLRALLAREDGEAVRARLDHLAALVARLHRAGWYHRDLYLEHVIATGGAAERLALLDLGRARCEPAPRERWFVKDMAALLHSAPAEVPAQARLRFLTRYMDARELFEPGRRRSFQRQVERKAARLAAHAPRHVDPGNAGKA